VLVVADGGSGGGFAGWLVGVPGFGEDLLGRGVDCLGPQEQHGFLDAELADELFD
jgi:hypothetical protein